MPKIDTDNKNIILHKQLLWLSIAQLSGASIIYLPGVIAAGRNVWISNIIASVVGYMVIFSHYLPLSSFPNISLSTAFNKYWGTFLGRLVNIYYFLFFFILSCLIVSDIFYFGKTTMPETPSYIFTIFFLIPAIYAVKLGIEVIVRLIGFLTPIFVVIYCVLFFLTLPKLDFARMLPIMSEGIKPVLAGAIPNMIFPFAQILPVVFYYKNVKENDTGKRKFVQYTFISILMATILLASRALSAVTAFEESTLKTLTYPPFSTIRIIEVGDIIERLDPLLLAIFYGTTFFKFILTYNVICEIISDCFKVGKPKDFALPIAVLIGVSTPFLIPRFDIILETVVPYFYVFLPLFLPIPLLLFLTIKFKNRKMQNYN